MPKCVPWVRNNDEAIADTDKTLSLDSAGGECISHVNAVVVSVASRDIPKVGFEPPQSDLNCASIPSVACRQNPCPTRLGHLLLTEVIFYVGGTSFDADQCFFDVLISV